MGSNVSQKPLQYCKVISLKLIKINEKKVLVSAEQQGNQPYIKIHLPSFMSLRPSHPHPTLLGPQSTELRSLCYIAAGTNFQCSPYMVL